jgi:hypothetical protein
MNFKPSLISRAFPRFDKTIPDKPLPTDFHLVSYPKSGNTWLRYLIADAIIRSNNIEFKVDESSLNFVVPGTPKRADVVNSDIRNKIIDTGAPRVFKSHSAYNKHYPKVILLVRDPRDVMVSYFLYSKERLKNFNGSFSEFIRSNTGIYQWLKHTNSWLNNYDFLINYEELLDEPIKSLRRLFDFIGIENLDDATIEEIVMENSILKLREKSPSSQFTENFNFFRSGKSKDWINHFSKEDLAYYESLNCPNMMEYSKNKHTI